ncbi:MAG TPA: septal ring lytic transglycosylase RlpA family protein, partial [Casimicrobiaceae bacterium]|nr:septal ring lytic transglycosylase RlpA family protein [Casimicrobiaceae bacterium]
VAVALAACAPLPTTPPAGESAPAPPAVEAPATAPPSVAQPPAPEPQEPVRTLRGKVSMYGDEFAGRKTANGEVFDPQALTMAHRTLPFGTRVRVTNLENHRSVEVVVNDRGPFIPSRIADLSEAAAKRLGMVAHGVVDALLEIVAPARH